MMPSLDGTLQRPAEASRQDLRASTTHLGGVPLREASSRRRPQSTSLV
eukprot:CAMPEP_0175186790 /NCGR_PEP_ID=MMETSP0093-20121207/2573_1 /TAXON_ID=311494 /ORGANISM="Alexandrium monilatum, Strain CCMP3105" /LENGTH=47 /DNA_ID= /DNA_START= /DNA_END= /DNA_ORIENTATION=